MHFKQIEQPCLPNPCLNGGTCNQVGSLGYLCQCTSTCFGNNCSTCINTPSNSTSSSSMMTIATSRPMTTSNFSVCEDFNTNICNYYASNGYCRQNAYTNNASITTSCAVSCKTCTPTTTRPSNCVDSQSNCFYWRNNCAQLANLIPHPCPLTCNRC